MNENEIREKVLWILGGIAPEADPDTIRPEINLRDQLDIDSMDYLNFIIALDREFHVEVPEKDYAGLMTLDGCVTYLAAALAGKAKE